MMGGPEFYLIRKQRDRMGNLIDVDVAGPFASRADALACRKRQMLHDTIVVER